MDSKLIRKLEFILREDGKYDVNIETKVYDRKREALCPATIHMILNDLPNGYNLLDIDTNNYIFTMDIEE